MRCRSAALVLAALWLVALAGPVRAAAPLSVFVSAHYEIHTDLTRRETIPFGRHLDAMYAEYRQRFSSFKRRDVEPMPLYLFRTQGDYEAFLRRHDIHAERSGGVFFVKHGLRGLATWVDGRTRSETFAVLQHEGFHQFAWAHLGPRLPTWVNEGLAQYFEDAVVLDRRMRVGLRDRQRIEAVRRDADAGRCLALSELMTMTAAGWSRTLRDDPDLSHTLYAQSWSIVYFLIHGHGGRYQAAFERYLRYLGEGYAAEVAFARGFGSRNIAGLERHWRDYLKTLQPDAVSLAVDRMTFLGNALAYKASLREPAPDRLQRLRDDLQARAFTVTRTLPGWSHTTRALDDAVFTYDHPNGYAVDFLLLEPTEYGLPPRITAPGLDPEPTLRWSRGVDGSIRFDIDFR